MLALPAIVVVFGCATAADPAPVTRTPEPAASPAPGGETMMFIQIEGSLDELRGLTKLRGIELSRGVADLGGGRWKAGAVVHDKAALDEIHRRGLKVTVTLDEDEVQRRARGERDRMKAARPDSGTDKDGGKDGGKDGDGGGSSEQ